MNIYALRDRMLSYYQRPFIAEDDKQVLAALAQTVNSGDKQNAIAQAPSHFELWKIASIETTGLGAYTIKEEGDELIATLDSLLRGSVRETPTGTDAPLDQTTRDRQGQIGGPDQRTGTDNRPATQAASTTRKPS